ncbi:hypothetical protein BN1221_04427c [Brenneria goodwinii]|uniref:Uncharacterized protein n=1 Tax=Brenneria goodwinii TaxID=1109412 RepID=A0A0G4K1S6_9GAMM|nr:hypothetical protein BN1221_04427c [Brenneria goodwinii]
MLLMLSLLLTACGAPLQQLGASSQQVKPAAYPQLPQQARQEPVPQYCSPTCSSALTTERESWQRTLTGQE